MTPEPLQKIAGAMLDGALSTVQLGTNSHESGCVEAMNRASRSMSHSQC